VSTQDFYPASWSQPGENGNGSGSAPYQFSAPRERHWLYALLFAVTLITTTVVGAAMQHDFERNLPFDVERTFRMWGLVWGNPALLISGLPFSLTLLTILLAHEFGHYLACVYYRIDASLPYFLPSPFFGTFGAFIRIRSPIYSKRALFDVGIAGPLAGFTFLLPALGVGLAFSKVVPGLAHQSTLHFGIPVLERLLDALVFPGAAPGDIYLHPVGRAAWVGIFATALNLLPIGQLDGGHILYARWSGAHRTISKVLAICLLPLGWLWLGWLIWGLVLLWLGRRHPMIYDESEIDPGRRKLALVAFVVFLLCFMWTPIGAGY
jgi:membrane-associated protease RseP (regulator of RpoE activity)